MTQHVSFSTPSTWKFFNRQTGRDASGGRVLRLVACLSLLVLPALGATEYFVVGSGKDTNDGRSREQAFATIQRGVDALAPGDTLTIGPGMYFENVKREGLGGPDADTTIRSQIPGTAVLRGDVDAPEFKKIEGFRFIYGAPVKKPPLAVLDHAKLLVLRPKANLAELDFSPGHFYRDEKAGMLYVSNADLTPPGSRRYTLAASGQAGIELTAPQRVVIDGLAASGFYPEWGINLITPESCVVRNCVTYLSVGGIMLGKSDNGGSNNLIENCVSYAHTFGGIVRYGANNDIIRNNRTFRSKTEGKEHFGIMHYLRMKGPLLIQNNIAWGQSHDFSVKPIGQDTLENNVALGFIRNKNMSHNLVGGGNEYDRSSQASADNILFRREKNLEHDFEFADPHNLDFRLQPDSSFRGNAPDGSDRGPFPYEATIYYLSPEGDDDADGLSMRSPWRSLEHALPTLKPGDTLYLADGTYPATHWKGAGDGKEPIRIRGRGRGEVVISGPARLSALNGVEWERLGFDGTVDVEQSRDLMFKNCSFYGQEGGLRLKGVSGAKVVHCMFANAPLDLKASDAVFLQGSLFANSDNPAVRMDSIEAILHSDFNSYQNGAICWEVGTNRWSFEDLQGRHDANSLLLVPEFADGKGLPRPSNPEIFAGRGPRSTAIGIYHEYEPDAEPLELVGPLLHSVGDTTANIEWWSSQPATFDLAWGETPETKNLLQGVKGNERFNTFSLTGLEPGKTYFFRIRSAQANPQDGVPSPLPLEPRDQPITFATANAPVEPQTLVVAPNGDDANPGSSREQALRTVNRAAALAGPGDTILIAGGEYRESVRIRAAGTAERPITFRAIPGEKPVFSGEDLALAFDLNYKPHHRFEGLYFDFNPFQQVLVVRDSTGVEVERCFSIRITAQASPDLVVRNCVLRGGWQALLLNASPRAVIENNVFSSTILNNVGIGQNSLPVTLRRNIFFDNQRNKTHQTLMNFPEESEESDNAYHLRWPEDEKLLINDRPITEIRARRPIDSVVVNPMMPGAGGHKQGWMRSKGDDFNAFFSAHPELIMRDIGLQQQAFAQYPFSKEPWPFDRQWAEKILAAKKSADQLVEAGNPGAALQAYLEIQNDLPLPPLLESKILDAASLAAEQTGDWEQAVKLAKAIPIDPMSIRRQMQIMLARGQHAGLVETFSGAAMGGRTFDKFYEYPETEELMEELFALRAEAHQELGDLKAAEADLRVMNDKRQQMQHRSGEAIHDRVALRLGYFYRDVLKDEDRALEQFRQVIDRTTWTFWGRPLKPAARGADQTLVDATSSAATILRKRGQTREAEEIEFDLLLAQAEAAAAVLDQAILLARFREMAGKPGRSTPTITANASRLQALPEKTRSTTLDAIAELAGDLRPDTRSSLVKAALGSNPDDRTSALIGLLMFVPDQNKVATLIDKIDPPKLQDD